METIAKEEREEEKGEAKTLINQLNAILLKAKRYDNLERSTHDTSFQEQLMIELLPEKMLNV